MPLPDHNALARLRLAHIPWLGPLTQRALVERFGSAAAVFDAGEEIETFAGPHVALAVSRGPDPALIERALRWAQLDGHHLIAYEEDRYPSLLREITAAPGILYATGDIERLRRQAVAVVGARNATPQGVRDAEALACALSQSGVCIVSGLALGIDAAAHRGGLAGPGSTVAVMGTGADIHYPRRNRDLALRIESEGCIITEFALGTPPISGNFPRRNRLISGLARAVLVVEANEKSGSLVTARCALEQDRAVLAVPGSIHSPLSKGCHKLIKEGATLVESAADVQAELGMARDEPDIVPADPREPDAFLEALGEAPATLDQIAIRTGLAAPAISVRLSRLQIEGTICELPGGRYQRIARAR